jgi:hypothetical protein
MRQASIFAVGVFCAALVAGCGNNRSAQATNDTGSAAPADAFGNVAASRPQPADVRGCLTASGDQFVLTVLQDASAASKPTTETYQLTKTADQAIDLKSYVGKEVEVTGEADPPRVADVQQGESATPAATTGQDSQAPGDNARVGTTLSTRFTYRKLAVSSVTPTGDPCPAASATPEAR